MTQLKAGLNHFIVVTLYQQLHISYFYNIFFFPSLFLAFFLFSFPLPFFLSLFISLFLYFFLEKTAIFDQLLIIFLSVCLSIFLLLSLSSLSIYKFLTHSYQSLISSLILTTHTPNQALFLISIGLGNLAKSKNLSIYLKSVSNHAQLCNFLQSKVLNLAVIILPTMK